jgi:hypothetical protein
VQSRRRIAARTPLGRTGKLQEGPGYPLLMHEYHEGLWLAVAAAAPVIAIGYLIILERSGGLFTRALRGRLRVWAVSDLLVWVIAGVLIPTAALYVALESLSEERDGVRPDLTAALALSLTLLLLRSGSTSIVG